MHGRKISDYDLPEPDQTLPQLHSRSTEATEAEPIAVVSGVPQAGLENLSVGKRSIFNAIAGTVRSGLTRNKVRLPLSEVLSSPNARDQIHQVYEKENFSQSQSFFLNGPGEDGKHISSMSYEYALKLAPRDFSP